MTLLRRRQLGVAISMMGFASLSQAALTVNGQNANYMQQTQSYQNQGYARVARGDSLENARTIMYGGSSAQANSYSSNESSNDTAKSFKNYTHNYTEIPKSYNSYSSSYNNYNSYNSYGNNYGNYGNSYDKLAINTGSRGVMVVDLVTGEPIYQKNASVARPIASITKVMTAMVVLDAAQNMREEIQIKPFDFQGNGYTKTSSAKLKTGDRLSRSELLLMMLMKSENPSAKALARSYPGGYSAFMRAMNNKARQLGMTSAFFGDPTGLDTRNVASPEDLVKMLKAAGNYDIIRRYSTTANHNFYIANYSRGNRSLPLRNTNYLVRNQSYPISIQKTGFINEAGKCVVMETRINNNPAIVVLLGAKSYGVRNKDAETILASLSSR